jgi:hypothetical protein
MVEMTSEPPDGTGDVPTGWKVLAKSDAVVDMIDTILDLPPHREFHKSELADMAGLSRKSVHTHLGLLLRVGLITEVEGTTPTRYRFNTESEVAEQLIKLDAAVNNAGPHAGE